MMNKRFLTALAFLGSVVSTSFAEDVQNPLWMRYCAISPNGQTIAFCYKGDIFTVNANGGDARQLTTHPSFDGYPVWSPEGDKIAFASTREGSFDVYIVPISGGAPTRITTHSGTEIPVAFADSKQVVYRSTGIPTTESLQFPNRTFFKLYQVEITGGRPTLFSELTMDEPNIGPNGQILYTDKKGYEDFWRKHQTSSIARDIWLYTGKKYTKLTDFKGEDRNAVWAPDGKSFYYLNEQDGTFNIHHRTLNNKQTTQITRYKNDPVRFLSIAKNGTLCYGQNGEIYTLPSGGVPKKIEVRIATDSSDRQFIRSLRTSGASAVAISEKNKEIAFIMNGDVYVTSMDYKTTKQITDTPELERNIDFSPDGRSVLYSSERNGVWQVYQTSLVKSNEKNFCYATEIKEENLTNSKETCFQATYSPDGNEIAFLRNRTELCVLNLKSKKIRTVMESKYQYSYSDGDQRYTWSPDSKWLLTEYIGTNGWNNKDIALVKADGSELHNLTNSGYTEGWPKWVLDGKAMIFRSDRAGYRSHGSWGAENDQYIMFFDVAAYEKFRMNDEELYLLGEREKEEKAEKKKKEDEEAKKKEEEAKKKKNSKKDKKAEEEKPKEEEKKSEEWKFDLDNLEDRTLRLTTSSSRLGDAVLSKNGDKLFYVAPYQAGVALWMQDLKKHSTTLKIPGFSGGMLIPDNNVEHVYVVSGAIRKINLERGNSTNIDFEAFVNSRPYEERSYLFDHIWHQVKEKIYDPNMNGADWPAIRQNYIRFLPHINNGHDFAEMCSEMLGELNVSHTGCRHSDPSPQLVTAVLGLFYDETHQGDGLKIKEIISKSPLSLQKTEIEEGCIIESIDGQVIKAGEDYFPLLAGKAGITTRLTINKKGKRFDVLTKPITAAQQDGLLYHRWVKRNEEIVEKISNGRIAYVHIRAMNSESFHKLYKELLSDKNRQKEAVVVDTRHNGGGWLHDDICILLSGKKLLEFKPRGQTIGQDPFNRWSKPSCMLVCEDNYSNAHGTPWYYKEMGIGKVIGTPVPGTMTAVWWESIGNGQFVYGIPEVTCIDNRGEILENNDLMPDIEVYNAPEEVLKGVDKQLERAVKELLK